jgi:curli production assembly/transport component CsgF
MRLLFAAAALAAFAVAPQAHAQQLMYSPQNPAFGGSPLNYSWLLSSAQAQNSYQDNASSRFTRDPLADFESSLQRQILNQLSRELIFNRFGDLDLSQPGTFNLGDFQVEIIPGVDGISVRVFNLLTGDETVVTVPNF